MNKFVESFDGNSDLEFGWRFRNAWKGSKHRDLLQKELAKMFDVSQQSVSNWVNGYRYPNLDMGLRIAREFNVTLDWLYTGRLPKRPTEMSPYIGIANKLTELNPNQLLVVEQLIGLMMNETISAEQVARAITNLYGPRLT